MVCLLVTTVYWHKSLQFMKKSNMTLLPCLFMILLAVSMIKLCSTTFQPDLICIFKSSPFFYISCMKSVTHKFKDESTSELPRDGFFFPLCIYKNRPRITVFRKLKCPDQSMIPLPAEVRECLQKSIRLTSYILIQLIDLLYKRLILHANKEICYSFKSFAGGTFGIVIEKTDVAYLRSFP